MIGALRFLLCAVCAAAIAIGGVGPVWSAAPGAPRAASAPLPGLRLLLRTGDRAPDGGTITVFSDPTSNGLGDLMFGAVVQTGGRVRETLYLRTAAGAVTALVSSGQPAPTGGTFGSFSDLLLNDHGVVGFMSRNVGRGSPEAIYVMRGGVAVPVVAVGQRAPTSMGGAFTDFANPTVNKQGEIAFIGRLPGLEGIFTSTPDGRTVPALLSGQAAPGGGVFEFFLDGSPALNDHGQMAFVASTTVGHRQGVYALLDGQPVPIVTTRDAAPAGGQFSEFGSVVITNTGTVGFIGRSRDSKIPEALYVTGRAALVALAVAGEDVAGSPLTKFAGAAINDREDMVFQLSLPIIAQAIYLATRAGARPLLSTGDVAPGGGLFTGFSTPALNNAGLIAFVAETDDGRHGLYEATLP